MAKTTDRQTIDGVLYMLMDSDAQGKINDMQEDVTDAEKDIRAIKDSLDIEAIYLTDDAYISTEVSVGETVTLTPQSNNLLCYAVEEVEGYKYLTVNGLGWARGALWAFIDGNNKLISKASSQAGSDLTIEIPNNAAKCIINSYKADAGSCFFGIPGKSVAENTRVIEKSQNDISVDSFGNLLYPYLRERKELSSNSVTAKINGDGTITINGTASADGGIVLVSYPGTIKAGTYMYAGGIRNTSAQRNYYLQFDGIGYYYGDPQEVGMRRKRTDDLTGVNVSIRFVSGTQFNNLVIHPFLFLEESNNIESYQLQIAKHCIMQMFNNAVNISGINSKIAVCDGFDIDDDGNLYCGIELGTGASEYDPNVWTAYLVKANIADVEQTKETITAFSDGEALPLFTGFTMKEYQWAGAKKTGDNTILMYASANWSSPDSQYWYNGYVAKEYNLQTGQFGDIQNMTIKVGNVTYPLYIKYESGVGITDESLTEVQAIWSATGIEHPPWYGQEMRYIYYIQINPQKYNGYWWAALCLGGQSHALCKTEDMLNWEFVSDIPLGQASEEVALCFYGDYLYATSRGNPSIDSKQSQIIRCPVNSLTTASWENPILLNPCRGERPAIAAIDGKIYVMQCLSNTEFDGIMIPRSRRRIYVFDTDLNLLNALDIDFKYPILHPSFFVHGGNLFTVLSSDKRCFAATSGGDARSEISFTHLDESIFRVGMKNIL